MAAPRQLLRSQFTRFQRFYSSSRKVQEHDVLFLRQQGRKYPKWHVTPPLRLDGKIKLAYGASIPASDIIGRHILDQVVDSKGNRISIHDVSLASYITNTERLATPIYPHDANTIVNLLDLNLGRSGEDDHVGQDAPFEIFEAGTGMGSLTLHIARALHGANPAMPSHLRQAISAAPLSRDLEPDSPPSLDLEPDVAREYADYKASRRAILHTLDRNHKHTRGAFKIVRNFRRSQYISDIDFHIGSVQGYIQQRLEANNGEPFLSRAILDLPAADEHAEDLVKALRPDATLIIFNPSISQIADFQLWMTKTKQPLRLEKVVELPTSTVHDGVHDGVAGGRHWDLKLVVPRQSEEGGSTEPAQVMRPKVGDRVGGGGFVGVLRRWPTQPGAEDADADCMGLEA